MKLTKTKLKQIIKEELQDVFGTQPGWQKGGMDPHTAALNTLEEYIYENYREDENLNKLMQGAVDAVNEFEMDPAQLRQAFERIGRQ